MSSKMRFDLENLGWTTTVAGQKVLITPNFRLAGKDYERIIVADIANEAEAAEALELVTPKTTEEKP